MRDNRRPFASDGCTLAPDLWFRPCCEAHDRAYWQGGNWADRSAADKTLRDCLAASGAPILSWLYYAAVRLAGHHFWPRVAKPDAWTWAGPVRRRASSANCRENP